MALETLTIVGAGAWGTALAQAGALAGRNVTLCGRDRASVEEINARHTNSRYLGGQALSERIIAQTEFVAADIIILAVPAQMSRVALEGIGAEKLVGAPVVLSAKGLETGSLKRQSEILFEVAPKAVPFVLSGPSFAADVAAGRPTAVTLAGDEVGATEALARALAGPGLRPYVSVDRVGVELVGGLKNIYALGCGAVEGAELGASARAALLARAFAEMGRMVTALGGTPGTLTGLAGLGDLTLSCTSTQSRNYRFGVALGEGRSRNDILASGFKLAEGVATAPAALKLAQRLGVEVPLIDAVVQLLAGRADINSIVAGLMARPLRREG